MDEVVLPNGRQVSRRITRTGLMVSLPTAVVVFGYIHLVLQFGVEEWGEFLFALLPVAALAGGYAELWRQRAVKPIAQWLDARGSRETSHEENLDAFEAVVAMPAGYQRVTSGGWLAAGLIAPVIMSVVDPGGWGLGFQSFVVAIASATGSLVSAACLLFAIKRELESVRMEIATQIHDPEERRQRIQRIPIARKMSLAVVGTVTMLLVFSMTLAYSRSGIAIDRVAMDWELRTLQGLAPALSHQSVDQGLAALIPNRDLLAYPANFEILDRDASASGSGTDDNVRAEIVSRVEEGDDSGQLGRLHQTAVWAWLQLEDGRILAASIPRADVRASFTQLGVLMIAVVLGSMGIAWLVARMISGDVSRSTQALGEAAERMALGDLRRGRIQESEDELGDLWRSFEKMGSALRKTVKSLAAAADRVDSAASEIAEVSDGVAAASAEQVRRIQQANDLMVEINRQVMDVSGSAQALNVSVEESSSSILELGAAGDELNETASVLGSKVDEVSSSIEQMVRSVQQVGSSSDGLAEAAAETSASMEEMASAMRAVDTTAEMTAELSRNVVGSAEMGQERVTQTIAGMQAISEATESAEGVIRGLGEGAKEIGAILDVIDDVADETNLLALNAAIIAAQAGEHGKAFSVVADEIKELADRVLASTKEIGGLIRKVQGESDNAVGAIEAGSKSVASGVELSAEAGLSLEEITRSSRESGQHIGEIVSAVQEQTRAASHVVTLMDKVRDGVEQIGTASAEQNRGNEVVYRSSVTMREVAQQVRRTTEEQSRGFGRIRESVEGVREAVEKINGSLQEQSSACTQVAGFLEEVSERTRSNEDAANSMGDSIRALVGQAEALREDVARFQI